MFKSYGVRLLDISMGNPYFNPHVNRPYAQGGYQLPEHRLENLAAPNVVTAYIQDCGFDIAGFGRTVFAYPNFAKDILATDALDKRKICICCAKCTEIMRTPDGTPSCVIRDITVYLPIYKEKEK